MRKFLLYSTILVAFTMSGAAEAACIQTPTCSSLGYSSGSSCTGGVKCPFGNAWNCTVVDLTNKISEITNKITTIEEKIVKIEKENATSNCKIGDILYSDMSCNTNVVASKTPIGVIFDVTNKLAIGLEESPEYWSMSYFDVPGLTSPSAATADWQGKNNTKVVLEYCKTNGNSCDAFEYVNSYKTEGTQAGDWYLPAMGELYAIYGNKDVLNITLGKIGGTGLYADYWSSSEVSSSSAWILIFNDGYLDIYMKDHGSVYVRPVLAF